MRKILTLLALSAFAACGHLTDPTRPGGLYLLAQVNGKALPTLDAQGDTLFSGAVELRPNGTYRIDAEGRSFAFTEDGTWTTSVTGVVLTNTSGTVRTTNYSPQRISVTLDRGTLLFTQF
jgi:hypothetical protein